MADRIRPVGQGICSMAEIGGVEASPRYVAFMETSGLSAGVPNWGGTNHCA